MYSEKIKEVALSYIGQQEKPGNAGFKDPEFERRMKDVGFVKGHAWCTYFTELVWKEAMPKYKSLFSSLFSGSATATLRQFENAGFKIGKTPKVGALAVFRYGMGWQGHIGVVVSVLDKFVFKSVEGNTNDQGGREGYIVAKKTRVTNRPYTSKGLNFIGFIYPPDGSM